MMPSADWLIDLGPGAGVLRRRDRRRGPPDSSPPIRDSLTGQIPQRHAHRRTRASHAPHARQRPGSPSPAPALNNLKNIDARISPRRASPASPASAASGKSSLIDKTLHPALARALNKAQETPGPYDFLDGLEHLDKIDRDRPGPHRAHAALQPRHLHQLFDEIRKHLRRHARGAKPAATRPSRFSFNVKGGRCEACKGHGQRKIEMHFLADVCVTCRELQAACASTPRRSTSPTRARTSPTSSIWTCKRRWTSSTTSPPSPACSRPSTSGPRTTSSSARARTTFSGGEAQRIKLAEELGHLATGRTLYILDEPTTGLHFADIAAPARRAPPPGRRRQHRRRHRTQPRRDQVRRLGDRPRPRRRRRRRPHPRRRHARRGRHRRDQLHRPMAPRHLRRTRRPHRRQLNSSPLASSIPPRRRGRVWGTPAIGRLARASISFPAATKARH